MIVACCYLMTLQPVHESLSTVRNGTIDDVLDVLISSGGHSLFHPDILLNY